MCLLLVSFEEHLVSLLVLSILLILSGDGHCYLSCILEVLKDLVEFIGIDGVFWLPISLPQQIVKQFLNQVLVGLVDGCQLQHARDL